MNLYQPTITGSLSVSGSVNISGSITIAGGGTISGTASIATTALTASSADNLLVRNTLTAQTLVVQTITSSVDFVTGSTRFGSISANTHQFTGSMSVTGSLAVVTTGTEFQVTNTGVNLGNALTDSHIISGSVRINPNGLFVSSSGIVGIGTSTPTGSLDVSGSIYIKNSSGGVLYIPRLADPSHGLSIGEQNIIGSKSAVIRTAGGVSEHLFIDPGLNDSNVAANIALAFANTGSVGIGTYLPLSKFHQVIDDGATYRGDARFGGSTTQFGIELKFTQASTTSGSIYVSPGYSSTGILFKLGAGSGNTNQLVLKGDGNVGINEIAPNAKLDIVGSSSTANTYGTLVVRNSSNTGISFGASGTSYTWMQGNVFGSGTQMIAINPQGSNVSIGTTTDFGYKLNLNGQPGANGYTAWTNWSDSRLKENVTDLEATNVLNKICTIRPVTYNYNELSGFDEATRARRISGFIAQELMEVFPDMVGTITKEDTEYYDTNLSNLNLYLVKAIQELKAEFDAYKITHP
jgi:hypothetical protein